MTEIQGTIIIFLLAYIAGSLTFIAANAWRR